MSKKDDKFISCNSRLPESGELCTITVESQFVASYFPDCKGWPWLMDDSTMPHSKVTGWKTKKGKMEDE